MSTTTVITELSSPTLKIALLSPEEPGKTFVAELEERLTPFIPYEKLETLYFTSGLVFEIIDKHTNKIVGQGFYFEGSEPAIRDEFALWADKVKLKSVLTDAVRDILLAGGAWGELVLNRAMNEIVSIKPLNPKTMDFIRDTHNYVKLREDDGTPEGYVRKYRGYKKIEWRKENIQVGGEETYKAKRGEDCRDRIYYFKFWSLSESYLGYTPLVSVYKDELIRLNISDAVGESAFRGTGIVATVSAPEGIEIPTETLDKLEKDLQKVRSKTIFVFPEQIKLDRFPIAEMREMHMHLDYFTNAVCTGLGIKRELLMTPVTRMAKADVESSKEEFENRIMTLQERLAEQVNEQIIKFRARLKGIDNPPKLVFRTAQRAIKLSEARRRATLARAGLLTYDPEVEIKIRDEEGLPHTLLDKEKESWRPKKRKITGVDLESLIEDTIRKVMEEYAR